MRKAAKRHMTIVQDSARWEGFPFREDDIVISAPMKCGTTWTQMICAELVFQTPHFDQPLSEISPWLDMLTTDRNELVDTLEAQSHRRIIKTHTPLDFLPLDDRVTYICIGRDPRDVGISWAHHKANENIDAFLAARQRAVGIEDIRELLADGPLALPQAEMERFWYWVNYTPPAGGPPGGLAGLFHHIRTFWPAMTDAPNLVLLHYDDLQIDLEGQMRSLARRLSIDVPEERWPELVTGAKFSEMRRRANHLVPNRGDGLWHNNTEFFHRGTSGQWRTQLNDDDLRRYHARIAELGDPDVADWVHRDPPVG